MSAYGPTSATPVLYLQEPGTNQSISPGDINQGELGDCYFLSALGEIARVNPNFIQNDLIHPNANGTESVTLYVGTDGRPATFGTSSFTPVQVTVDNRFDPNAVNSLTSKDTYNGQQEVWPQVIEEAYANLNGGYDAIKNGGYDMMAMETLTGKAAHYMSISSATPKTLNNQGAGAIMEFDTKSSGGLGYNLVDNHAYMFDGFEKHGNVTMVKLLNPWGTHEPSLIPWNQVTNNFQGVTIGHV